MTIQELELATCLSIACIELTDDDTGEGHGFYAWANDDLAGPVLRSRTVATALGATAEEALGNLGRELGK